MEQQNTLNVAKIIACILIVSVVMETISAAALPIDDKKSIDKKKLAKKNMPDHPKMFSKKDFEAWTNPCNADGYDANGILTHVDRTEAYKKIKLTVDTVKHTEELKNNDKINTTNYEAFDYFNAVDYEFLPTKPTNVHKKWHVDLQIYVATFGLLYKEQHKKDTEHNDDVLSKELYEIFKAARELLCAIEDFVNATSTERISSEDWFTKKEMRSKLQFKNLTDKLTMHRTYAKGRFQGYIKKLHDRINAQIMKPSTSEQPLDKHPKLKALKVRKPTRRPRNWSARRRNRLEAQQQQQQQQQNGDTKISPTKRVHIIRTTNRPTQIMKKKDKSRRQRQQSRITTTTTKAPIKSTV